MGVYTYRVWHLDFEPDAHNGAWRRNVKWGGRRRRSRFCRRGANAHDRLKAGDDDGNNRPGGRRKTHRATPPVGTHVSRTANRTARTWLKKNNKPINYCVQSVHRPRVSFLFSIVFRPKISKKKWSNSFRSKFFYSRSSAVPRWLVSRFFFFLPYVSTRKITITVRCVLVWRGVVQKNHARRKSFRETNRKIRIVFARLNNKRIAWIHFDYYNRNTLFFFFK